MSKRPVLRLLVLLLSALLSGISQQITAQSELTTQYGFFPSPPIPTLEAILQHFADMGEHADFVLSQPNIPWEDFLQGVDVDSQLRQDMRNLETLSQMNHLGVVYVVDPLNGLNRREFSGLPADWEASFANPDVRTAFSNFAVWIAREFQPEYLGLASEINSYMDAHPDDAANYLSLYTEVYAAVKAESPETQVFVTFQWEDLNNLWQFAAEGRDAYDTNWNQVEMFEPNLDVWAISTYPYVPFPSGTPIPDDFYSILLEKTDKPLAVSEGGYTARPVGSVIGTPEDQAAFLNAVHDQIGSRLGFWAYTLLNDIDMESYTESMQAQGVSATDINTLGVFQSIGLREVDGTPRPALTVWDSFRQP
ncbi:MAG: hypothetical protein H6672_15005 [Anaerolineaceae bacterium]|nr:hypothetical protein [Anaerolineaceae bacterium]